ncbi:hypothetical protein V6Z11_A03G184700 [Gossypium hirsutum]
MKKSALFSVSLAATISAFTPNFQFTSEKETENENSTIKKSTLTEKFAPSSYSSQRSSHWSPRMPPVAGDCTAAYCGQKKSKFFF